jgi:hypothetical protein
MEAQFWLRKALPGDLHSVLRPPSRNTAINEERGEP